MFETEHNYKVIEVIGTSDQSWEEAAKSVIQEASEHLRDLRIAEVVAQDCKIDNGKIVSYRTKLHLSFKFHGD
jgi:flavin-binding protein dodecin